MSLCQEGIECVWGRKYSNTIICSIPHCPMVRLRTGNVDKLRKEFIVHVERRPVLTPALEEVVVAGTPGDVGGSSG